MLENYCSILNFISKKRFYMKALCLLNMWIKWEHAIHFTHELSMHLLLDKYICVCIKFFFNGSGYVNWYKSYIVYICLWCLIIWVIIRAPQSQIWMWKRLLWIEMNFWQPTLWRDQGASESGCFNSTPRKESESSWWRWWWPRWKNSQSILVTSSRE